MRESAAWFDVSARGRIQAAGEDRARLLHAMTTNHIQELTPGGGVYAFFLNAQGRILADVYVFCRERDFLLDTEPRTRQSAFEHLDQYIIMDDVTLEDVSGQTCELAVEGPASADLLSAIVGRLPEKENCFVERNGGLVARVNATGAEGWRLIAPVEEKDKLAAQLEAAGAVAAAAGDVEIVRLEHGAPALRGRFRREHHSPRNAIDARAALQQGLLPGAGDCRARAIARSGEPSAGAASY